MRTAICLASYIPPHPSLVRLCHRSCDLNDWLLLEAQLPKEQAYQSLLDRAREGGLERLVWLHPKLDALLEQIEVMVATHETTGASTVCGVVTPWEHAVRGDFQPNFEVAEPGSLTIAGESSGVVEARRCTLDLAVTEVGESLQDLTERDVLLDTRILCGVWVERPFYPQDARNLEAE